MLILLRSNGRQGSSKVSLAAVHKKQKSPVSNKMEGMHNNWDCPLTLTYMWAHTPQQDDVQKAKWQRTGISFLPLCNKQHVQKRPPYTYLGEAGHESCSFWEDASFLLTSLFSFSKALSLFLCPWCNPLSWYTHKPGNPSRCAWDAPIKTRRPCACQTSALMLTHSQSRNWFLSSDHHGVMAKIWSVGSRSLEVIYF